MVGQTFWYKPRKRNWPQRNAEHTTPYEDEVKELGTVFFDEEKFEEEGG